MEHHFDLLHAFKSSGFIGWLICFAALGVAAVGLALLVFPPRKRIVAPVLAVYALLCMSPVVLGFVGKTTAEISAERVLATLKEPTPEDRARGYAEARDTLILGALLSIPGALLLPLIWLRRREDVVART